jgi:glutamate--cysteine ligase
MTTLVRSPSEHPPEASLLRTEADVAAYVAKICFKTGPPELVGVELEWTVHHAADPARPLDPVRLITALDSHAPPSLHPPTSHDPLPAGSTLTVEPGGQVEISSPPYRSLTELYAATSSDLCHLTGRLSREGLALGPRGIDSHRSPRRLLRTPRYDAMAAAFNCDGPHGITMMCSTAGLQVCLDAGQPGRVAARWAALHELGPVLLAAFANSPRHAGRDTGWASYRMAAWFGIDPRRTAPVPDSPDLVTAWTRYALRAPLVCVRGESGWHAPPGVSFADWLAGAFPRPPTVADLELHLSTLFPPVRPRGYFEVRYLDAQHPDEWLPPVAVLAALFADESTVDRVRELCAPVAGRWLDAARHGLADAAIAAPARDVLDLALRRLDHTDLTNDLRKHVTERLEGEL